MNSQYRLVEITSQHSTLSFKVSFFRFVFLFLVVQGLKKRIFVLFCFCFVFLTCFVSFSFFFYKKTGLNARQ